jgi:RimJ/RimL family protein N-acetyltransferase
VTILQTPRLVLRPVRPSDAEIITQELNNYAIAKNTARIPYPYALTDAGQFIAWSGSLDHRSLVCAITHRADIGRLKGVISYEWSDAKGDAELGYWLAEDMWRQGFGFEAASAMTRHAMDTTGLNHLVASYHAGNEASRRILARLGFEETGTGHNFSKAQNREVPIVTMELGKEAWERLSATDPQLRSG